MEDNGQTMIGAQRISGEVNLYLRIGGRPLQIILSDFNANLIINCLKEALAEPIVETPNHLKGKLN